MIMVPITIREANEYVARWHRHSRPVRGGIVAVGALRYENDTMLCGVAIIGRPVSRELQSKGACEITRLATDGGPNVCSKLYAHCRRVAQVLGYRRCVTYTLASESGASLRAAGAHGPYPVRAASWDCPSRRRTDKHSIEERQRWELPIYA